MRRIKLIVSYDGTNYVGWQKQINGIAVEEIINKALSKLLNEDIEVIGASRTDSGVHALGNVAVFDTESRIPGDKFCFALNQYLPEDIRIQESCEVDSDFHPRFCDTIKTYEYSILNRRFDIPTSRLYHYFMYMPLDVEKMQAGAVYIKGEHDFKSFCSARSQVKDTVREVTDIQVFKEGEYVKIRVSGTGFLYNMVRIIAGTLIKVGLGVYPPEYVKEILDAKDRNAAGPKAPARGLTLIEIKYL
jgi:tRNA pseudouridine38-40 synthase